VWYQYVPLALTFEHSAVAQRVYVCMYMIISLNSIKQLMFWRSGEFHSWSRTVFKYGLDKFHASESWNRLQREVILKERLWWSCAWKFAQNNVAVSPSHISFRKVMAKCFVHTCGNNVLQTLCVRTSDGVTFFEENWFSDWGHMWIAAETSHNFQKFRHLSFRTN
jgi:hypothetical protein